MKFLLARLTALRRDEDGQSLVFGVLSAFLMLFFGAMIIAVGRVSTRRIQMQFAADTAAYSASLVESECLNAIGLLNTGMAQVRGRALRYVADVNAYGVLAEMRDEVLSLPEKLESTRADLGAMLAAETDPDRRSQLEHLILRLDALHSDSDPDNDLLSMAGETFWTQQLAVLAPELAAETRSDRRTWLQQQIDYCEDMRAGLHINGDPAQPLLETIGSDPLWLQETVGMDRAHELYAEAYGRARDWRDTSNEWLQEMSRLEYTVSILAPYLSAETAYRISQENGAEYASIFPCSRWLPRENAYVSLDVYRLGPEWWRVEGDDRAMEVRAQDCDVCERCPACGACTRCWLISWFNGLSQAGRYRVCQLEDRRWYFKDLLRDEDACIQQYVDFHIVTWGPSGAKVIVHDEYDPYWLEIINTNSDNWPQNTIFVRTVDGVVEQARYQWDEDAQEWVMPTEDDFVPLPSVTVELDGVRISVTIDPVIPLPGSEGGQAVIRTLHPPSIEFRDIEGNVWGRAHLDDTTSFWTVINGIEASVHNDDFHLRHRGQTIHRGQADGRWRTHFDPVDEYWWQHRLTEVETEHWEYEYMEFGARLAPERNMARLLAHRDVDGPAGLLGEVAGAWHLPSWAYDGELNPAGWLDPSGGAPVRETPEGSLGNTYKYYQARATRRFDPLDSHGNTEDADGVWWFDFNHDGDQDEGETLISPFGDGLGYVLMEPSDVFGREGLDVRDDTHVHRGNIREVDYQEADFEPERMPLVLTEEFFKYGFTAGVWRRSMSHFPRGEDGAPATTGSVPQRPVEYLLHDPEPGFKGIMRGTAGSTPRERGERVPPAWGYFAVSAARPRLNRPGASGDWGGLKQGAYFEDVEERESWLENNLNNLYLKEGPTGWTHWDSRLVALDRQVLDEDVMLDHTTAYETGMGWLMKRIAFGSPGGLIRSRHVPWRPGEPTHGISEGWTSDIFGSYKQSYPPAWVRRDLTSRMRPRRPTPVMGRPYLDADGLRRDPLTEYLGDRAPGYYQTGGQLDYNDLDSDSVFH